MGGTAIFGKAAAANAAADAAAGGSGIAGAGAGAATAQAKGMSPVSTSLSSHQSSLISARSEREADWRSREPPSSHQHRLGNMTATDGSTVAVRMSDMKGDRTFHDDGSVTLTVSTLKGNAQVRVDGEQFKRMEAAYQISAASWKDRYSRWRDEGEYQGWVAGYDGIGAKAARRTEF